MQADAVVDTEFAELMDKLAKLPVLNAELLETHIETILNAQVQKQLLIKLLLENAQSLRDPKELF